MSALGVARFSSACPLYFGNYGPTVTSLRSVMTAIQAKGIRKGDLWEMPFHIPNEDFVFSTDGTKLTITWAEFVATLDPNKLIQSSTGQKGGTVYIDIRNTHTQRPQPKALRFISGQIAAFKRQHASSPLTQNGERPG